MKDRLIGYVYEITRNSLKIKVPYDKIKYLSTDVKNFISINNILITKYNSYLTICFTIEKIIDISKQNFNFLEWNKNDLILECIFLGTYNFLEDKFNLNIKFYPKINSEVFFPTKNILEKITSINSKYKIRIGYLQKEEDIPVFANPDLLFGKHLAIFGNTGSGKSRTVASLLDSIKLNTYDYKNNKLNLKPKIIIIDPYNEYKSILPNGFGYSIEHTINKYNSNKPLSLPWNSGDAMINEEELSGLLTFAGNSRNIVKDYIQNQNQKITLRELYDNLKKIAEEKKVSHHIRTDLIKLNTILSTEQIMEVIEGNNYNSIVEFLNSNTECMKIKLEDRADGKSLKQDLLIFLITKSIYMWIKDQNNQNKKHIVLVIDETHRYLNKNKKENLEFVQKYFELLFREGRKHNFSIIMSSQCPSDIPELLISQCNSFILHKIINKSDYDILKKIVSNEGFNYLDELKILETQCALICGEGFSAPLIIKLNTCDKLDIIPKSVIETWIVNEDSEN